MTNGTALLTYQADRDRQRTAQVEIVIPVYNEEAGLEASIRRLHGYLTTRFPLTWRITIADNASIDRTWGIACKLAADLDGVGALHLDQKGRGRALRTAWLASDAPVVAYMDVDLSTDLDALLPLVAPLLSGHSDLAIGTRLATGSRVVRGPKREAISRSYNLLLKATLRSGFSDAQCGFKAVRTDVAELLLPLVEDQGWFFDTELLVLAEHNGLRIHEVPVDWVDDPDSRVNVVGTATDDLKGIWRMARRIAGGGLSVTSPAGGPLRDDGPVEPDLPSQLVRFASIGLVSTVVFALLFLLLVGPLGAFAANVVALGVCTVANTAANRRLTFAFHGRAGRRRHYGAGLALAALPLVLTTGALLVLLALGITSVGAELVALTAANLAAAVVRFVLLRRWVFRPDVPTGPAPQDRRGVGRPEGPTTDQLAPEQPADEQPAPEQPAPEQPACEPADAPVAGRVDAGPPLAGVPAPAPSGLRGRIRQLVRYGAVSVVATTTSLCVLGTLVSTTAIAPAWANVIATAVGTAPSFELNRRWVWGKTGQRSVWAEIGPFCVLSFAGLGLSTLAVAATASWAAGASLDPALRTVAIEVANLAAFGSLWVAQFLILDRFLFGRRAPVEATASSPAPAVPVGSAAPRPALDVVADAA